MDASPKRPRSSRWLVILGLLLTPVVLVGGLFVATSSSGARMLEEQLEAARKEGIPTTAADLRHPVDESQNAAPLFLQAIAATKSKDKAFAGAWKAINGNPKEADDPKWQADVKAAEPVVANALKLADQASRLSVCDFHREWEKGAMLLLPEYSQVRMFARAFNNLAEVDLREGRPKAALDRVTTSARIMRLVCQEPIIIAALVHASSDLEAAKVLREILARYSDRPEILAGVKKAVGEMGPPIDIKPALKGEVAMNHETFRGMERISAEEIFKMYGFSGDNSQQWPIRLLAIKPTRNIFEARVIEHWRGLINNTPDDPTDIGGLSKAMQDAQQRLDSRQDWSYAVAQLMAPVFLGIGGAVGDDLAQRRCLLAAVRALEAKHATGVYPAGLPVAGPDSIDPHTGTPLSYRRTRKGFVVYSVGQDKIDDGGVPRDPAAAMREDGIRTGDIAFQIPAQTP